jgi:hypothetical protein
MTCPNITATLKTVSCIFTSIRGTDLTANFNYNTSGSSHSILNIPGKNYYQKIIKEIFLFFFRCTILYIWFIICYK